MLDPEPLETEKNNQTMSAIASRCAEGSHSERLAETRIWIWTDNVKSVSERNCTATEAVWSGLSLKLGYTDTCHVAFAPPCEVLLYYCTHCTVDVGLCSSLSSFLVLPLHKLYYARSGKRKVGSPKLVLHCFPDSQLLVRA